MIMDYAEFLASKRRLDPATGIENVGELPSFLFDFQRDITRWAIRRGRAAIFAGTGLGKTAMELVWGDYIHRETGVDIIYFAPLAVTAQIIREAEKFGVPAKHVHTQEECVPGLNVTNYQKLDHFDMSKFGGVILDESSILKNVDGHYRRRLTEVCDQIPFRLAATATPAPNDFMELGTTAEFLGVMSYTDMLATFFAHDGSETQKWRLKGHAENDFWKWMASWSVMVRMPSDLGYDDGAFKLPQLLKKQHTVSVDTGPDVETGTLFQFEARTMKERLQARKASISERVAKAAELVVGSICDEVEGCLGSLNTRKIAEDELRKIRNMLQGSGQKGAERLRKIGNICENITKLINIVGMEELQNSVKGITPREGSSMQMIPSSQKSVNRSPGRGAKSEDSQREYETNTGYLQNNMMHSSTCRAEDAPSVEPMSQTHEAKDCLLITATAQDGSEGSYARIAITDSDILRIGPGCSEERLRTWRTERINAWVIWCHLNNEQNALEKMMGNLAISIHGSLSEEEKEERHAAWLRGDAPVLIVKPSMFGYGLNWQHCANTVFVGLNDSFEQVFQATRRFWRFGQSRPVNVHFIASQLEGAVVANLRRKEMDYDRMASNMVLHMADLSTRKVRGMARETPDYNPQLPMKLPSFINQCEYA